LVPPGPDRVHLLLEDVSADALDAVVEVLGDVDLLGDVDFECLVVLPFHDPVQHEEVDVVEQPVVNSEVLESQTRPERLQIRPGHPGKQYTCYIYKSGAGLSTCCDPSEARR